MGVDLEMGRLIRMAPKFALSLAFTTPNRPWDAMGLGSSTEQCWKALLPGPTPRGVEVAKNHLLEGPGINSPPTSIEEDGKQVDSLDLNNTGSDGSDVNAKPRRVVWMRPPPCVTV